MYVKTTNGNVDTYPYNVGRLRRDNPNTSFPKKVSSATLESYGVYPVVYADQPTIEVRTQQIEQEAAPTLVNGSWTVGWVVSSKSEDEVQKYDLNIALANRGRRDALLVATDWWASTDLTMTAEQTAYRQALRDITSHANWPHLDEADWPTKP